MKDFWLGIIGAQLFLLATVSLVAVVWIVLSSLFA